MIAKKNSKADLERKRFAFFQIGLIVAGSLTLAAFEYSTVHVEKKKITNVLDNGMTTWEPPVFEPIELEERPQPEQSASRYVMTPEDEVTITSKKIEGDIRYNSQTINITDPCVDCDGSGGLDIEGGEDNEIIDVPSVEPLFPGGEEALFKFIKENIQYPEIDRTMGYTGLVYVQFVVNRDGSISDIVATGTDSKTLRAEAVRVVSIMPDWTPGEQAGKKVRVRYTVPINFKIG